MPKVTPLAPARSGCHLELPRGSTLPTKEVAPVAMQGGVEPLVVHFMMLRSGAWVCGTHGCVADAVFFLGAQLCLSRLLPIAV